jgi:hypothetical protein
MCSMFLLSSQWILIRFLICSPSKNLFSNMFSIAPHFDPIRFGKCCPPFRYIAGPKGRNSILQNRNFYFGCPQSFLFLSNGQIKLAHRIIF